MHIVYVTSEFVTENKGGGLATYLSNISRIMVDNGHQVTIVTASDDNNDSILWGGDIIVERVRKPWKGLLVPLYILAQSWKLNKRVKKVQKMKAIDFIQYASFDAVGFFHIRKIPSAVRISSDCVSWREYKVYDYQKEDIKRCCLTDKLEYLAESKIGNIYGPSYATAELISARIHKTISIIESPFYFNQPECDETVYREKLQGKKYYLSHSSMSCLKGTHVIAEAIQKICKVDENAYLVFAGSDHGVFYRDGSSISVKEYVLEHAGKFKNRVIFLGVLDRKSLYPIIKNAFACLMPSRIDNMPNTCIEAMAMGKIVIGTRGASYEQLIEDGVSGYLIEVDNATELADAVKKAAGLNEQERERMCCEAKKITHRFGAEQIYQSIIYYYSEIIRRTTGRKL